MCDDGISSNYAHSTANTATDPSHDTPTKTATTTSTKTHASSSIRRPIQLRSGRREQLGSRQEGVVLQSPSQGLPTHSTAASCDSATYAHACCTSCTS